MDKLEEDLRDILEDPKSLATHEAILIKESSSFASLLQEIYRDMLPKPKLKKPALSGRVGIGAEQRRAAVTLNIRDSLLRTILLGSLSFLGFIFACFAHFGTIINNDLLQGTGDLIIHKNNLAWFKNLLIF